MGTIDGNASKYGNNSGATREVARKDSDAEVLRQRIFVTMGVL